MYGRNSSEDEQMRDMSTSCIVTQVSDTGVMQSKLLAKEVAADAKHAAST